MQDNIVSEEIKFEEKRLENKYTQELKIVNEESLKIKNQIVTLKKKRDNLFSQADSLKEINKEQIKGIYPLVDHSKQLALNIEEQNKDLMEKNKVIAEYEKKIYDLKKTTQELEKFKFVLDHTIKELNLEVGPKELEIKDLKEAIAKEDERLKHLNTANSYFEQLIEQLDKESKSLAVKILSSKDKLTKCQYKLEKTKTFLSSSMELILNYKALKEWLSGFNVKLIENDQANEQIEVEYEEQLGYLNQSLELFRDNIIKGAELHKIDNRNSIKENIQLIREILKLRKEIKALKNTEKVDTILLRKDKKLRNILGEQSIKLSVDDKKNILKTQEKEIALMKIALDR